MFGRLTVRRAAPVLAAEGVMGCPGLAVVIHHEKVAGAGARAQTHHVHALVHHRQLPVSRSRARIVFFTCPLGRPPDPGPFIQVAAGSRAPLREQLFQK